MVTKKKFDLLQCLKNVTNVIRTDHNIIAPMPRTTRKKSSSASGPKQMTVIRLPLDLRERLKARAEAEQRSLSNMAVVCIAERLGVAESAA